MKVISIAKQFSKFPAGRTPEDGPFSGQRFLTELLIPALKENDVVEIDLDDTMGYGSSFLNEVFGGLIKVYHLSKKTIQEKIKLKSQQDPIIIQEIWDYIDEEEKKLKCK